MLLKQGFLEVIWNLVTKEDFGILEVSVEGISILKKLLEHLIELDITDHYPLSGKIAEWIEIMVQKRRANL